MNTPVRRLGIALLVCLFLVSCNAQKKKPIQSAASASAPGNLNGTQWSLAALAGKPVIANSRATLTFPEAGKVAGNGSCNRFTGSAEINGSAIKFGPLAATRMMCEPDATDQETEYLKALEGARRFEMKNGKLYLYVSGRENPLVFHSAN